MKHSSLTTWVKRESRWAEKLYQKGEGSGGFNKDWFAGYSAAMEQVGFKLEESKPKKKFRTKPKEGSQR